MHTKSLPVTIAVIVLALFMFVGTALARTTHSSKSPLAMNKNVRYGKAAWYSEKDPCISLYTANHEIFNDHAMTCAIFDVPFNQMVRVTNLANGKAIVVRVNDRGPNTRLVRKGRTVDLAKKAFSKIASLKDGLIKVRLELL